MLYRIKLEFSQPWPDDLLVTLQLWAEDLLVLHPPPDDLPTPLHLLCTDNKNKLILQTPTQERCNCRMRFGANKYLMVFEPLLRRKTCTRTWAWASEWWFECAIFKAVMPIFFVAMYFWVVTWMRGFERVLMRGDLNGWWWAVIWITWKSEFSAKLAKHKTTATFNACYTADTKPKVGLFIAILSLLTSAKKHKRTVIKISITP